MKVLTISLFTLFPLTFTLAEIIHVPAQAPTIQQGIDQARAGDTVLVAEGHYYEQIFFKGKAITVASEFIIDSDTSHISKTIIDGSQHANPDSGTVVYFINGETKNSALYGFTITGGSGTFYIWPDDNSNQHTAGGIRLWAGGRVEYNRITNNVINRETGIYCHGGGIDIMCLSTRDTVIIRNNVIVKNMINAYWGGGAGVVMGTLGYILFENNIMNDNIYNSDGGLCVGGIYVWGPGEIEIYNNLIQGNESNAIPLNYGLGGGIYIENCSPKIYNNIVMENHTTGNGGGINVSWWSGSGGYANPILINNTIFNNTAYNGGGIYVISEEVGKANPVIMNTILWGNTSTSGPGINVGNNGSLQLYHSLVQDPDYFSIDDGVICSDPLFADTLGHLSEQSPAVGRGLANLVLNGTTYLAPATDFEGNPRPSAADPLVDIGACESEYEGQAYPLSYSLSDLFVIPTTGSQHCAADILNHHQQNIQVFSKFYNSDSSLQDSVEMFDDGEHADGAAADGVYAGSYQTNLEETFAANLVIQNFSNSTRSEYDDNKKFTTVGPVILAGYEITSVDTVPNPGDMIRLNFHLTNLSPTATAGDISIRLRIADSLASVSSNPVEFGDIGPGITATGKSQRTIILSENFEYPTDNLPVVLEIASNDYVFWYDSLTMVVGIANKTPEVPMVYNLKQNYPNPFNPNTTIEFTLPKSEWVTLKVFNVLGQQITTLVSQKLNPGLYKYEWRPLNLPSGIYYCRLQAGSFTQVRKMVLIR